MDLIFFLLALASAALKLNGIDGCVTAKHIIRLEMHEYLCRPCFDCEARVSDAHVNVNKLANCVTSLAYLLVVGAPCDVK